ncbi:quinone-dependent dihydroorotate dehydrogenase [Demequina lignilytica]|uniref:Dihydroorotate dehydrogenase (quinone) n=1 Tax=Demequina lignilytica TaxID=3051663 RepID=A0AB35MEJ5_9MICO|nr:quinone-dependent dihydroorotate dehydrogenase [Demequina sp. SYSU T0a273]MDN4482177.1 quinone-dependent dihydroorotate dehydrogenase [Demequina sp. SYSU T0a273]
MYQSFYRHLLSHIDAERAHRFGIAAFRMGAPAFRMGRALGLVPRPVPTGAVQALGLTFPAPVGLAAGMDKDAEAVEGLAAAGFGFVEVGTVTPLGQPGNERPRSWREKDIQGLRNRMGFNNGGAEEMAKRLARLRATRRGRRIVLGVNLGKNKVTPAEQAPEDYATSAALLARHADYLVVNVSSPNTPGLRDLQSVETLRPILAATRAAADAAVTDRHVPLLVKIAPDLADEDVDAVADLALELGLDGIVAANTTIAHDRGPGGLSGPPLLPRAVEIIGRLRARVGDEMCLIGVGGISSEDDARRMLAAGATLVQVYTAFVYRGPGWVARLNRALTAG